MPQSLHHLIPKLRGGKGGPTVLLHQICHNEIHATLSEAELARNFSTVEALRAHPRIAAFVAWVREAPAWLPLAPGAGRGESADARISRDSPLIRRHGPGRRPGIGGELGRSRHQHVARHDRVDQSEASASSAPSFAPAIRISFARAGPTSATRRPGSDGCGRKPSFITG